MLYFSKYEYLFYKLPLDTCLKVYGPWVLCFAFYSMYNRYYDVRYEVVLRDQNITVIVFYGIFYRL
jgi:hypothetical protein